MSILCIHPLIDPLTFTLLPDGHQTPLELEGKSLETAFPDTLIDWYTHSKPKELWCITWPWAFTRMRIVTLAINTLKLLHPNLILRGISFFDLFTSQKEIPILEANRYEYLVYQDGNTVIYKKDLLPPGVYTGIAQKKDFTDNRKYVEYIHDWKQSIPIFSQTPPQEILHPIYLKNPNITCPKK